jgi:DNA repair exonuclease SbcCD ATPase subunit
MNSIETVNARSTGSGRHTHRTQSEAERCPLCGSAISAATRARLDEKLRAQLAKAEQTLRDQFASEQQQAAAKAATEVARAKTDAAAQIEKARKEAAKTAAAALQPKMAEAVAQAVQVERTKAYGEKLALEQQLEEMKRKLQRKSAHDIGEPAEVDLHTMLVSAFPGDNMSRVFKRRQRARCRLGSDPPGKYRRKNHFRQQGSSSVVK